MEPWIFLRQFHHTAPLQCRGNCSWRVRKAEVKDNTISDMLEELRRLDNILEKTRLSKLVRKRTKLGDILEVRIKVDHHETEVVPSTPSQEQAGSGKFAISMHSRKMKYLTQFSQVAPYMDPLTSSGRCSEPQWTSDAMNASSSSAILFYLRRKNHALWIVYA